MKKGAKPKDLKELKQFAQKSSEDRSLGQFSKIELETAVEKAIKKQKYREARQLIDEMDVQDIIEESTGTKKPKSIDELKKIRQKRQDMELYGPDVEDEEED